MPVTSESLPLFTPKGYLWVCWVLLIILQFQCTAIENTGIDTINMIDRIDCINKYKDNRCEWSDRLTLQTSPTHLHHCCLLLWFAWLIKLRSIVVLHPVSLCWYAHICFNFFFCLPLNTTAVSTAEVRLLSQQGMDYWCVYWGELFLPGFPLLK